MKKKLLLLPLITLISSCATVVDNEPTTYQEATIKINNKSENGDAIANTTLSTYLSSDIELESIDSEYIYGTSDSAIRFSSASTKGSITLNFEKEIFISSVSLFTKQYMDDVATVYVSTDGRGSEKEITVDKRTIERQPVSFIDDNIVSKSLTIRAKASKNRFDLYGINVLTKETEKIYPTSISVDETSQGEVNVSTSLEVSYTPASTSIRNLTWSSSDPSVASVDINGNIKGLKEGKTTITVTAEGKDGSQLTASSKMTVVDTHVPAPITMDETYKDFTENNWYTISSCPSIGNPKLLIIPVWFSDSSSYIEETYKDNIKEDITKAYLGSEADTGWQSVKTYYYYESNGLLNLDGTVSDWYEADISSFKISNSGANKTVDLVESATDWYFSKNPKDSRTNYDSDNDGYLDGVILIYAAPDYSSYSSLGSNMWAYCYWCQKPSSTSNPIPNAFFWASYDFMYNTTKAKERTGSTYHQGDCSYAKIDSHTFIHEMGHIFGLDDYYDYSNQYKPAGGFSMQDYNVGGHDPYSDLALGWAEAYIPSESTTITIGAFQTTKELILLTPEWNSYNSPFDEYLLLELYTPTGLNQFDSEHVYENVYPQGPKTTGIRLWHVNAQLLDSYNNLTKTTTGSSVEHAFCNSYYSKTYTSGHLSPLGEGYYDYNCLQLLKNDTKATNKSKSVLQDSDLFTNNSSFDMNTYAQQFVNEGKLDSGLSLGWSFTVSISGQGKSARATITLTRQ